MNSRIGGRCRSRENAFNEQVIYSKVIYRYIKGVLPKNKMPTIGVEFATRIVPLQSNVKIKAQIWDTGRFI